MEYDYIMELLLLIKEYCKACKECEECFLFTDYGCYFSNKIPERFFEDGDSSEHRV